MSGTAFQNLFDKQSQAYSLYRPGYPEELFEFVLKHVPQRELAWDAGTGSGQAALRLAESFEKVIATDSSEAQISKAPVHAKISFRVGAETQSEIADSSCDLVTAASAIHWFDLSSFYPEVKRVLKDGGVIAAWCYSWLIVPDEIKDRIEHFYKSIEPYWPAPLEHVRTEYRNLDFPFEEIPATKIIQDASWTLERMLGFYSSWSGVQVQRDQTGKDSVQELAESLRPLKLEDSIEVKIPIHLRVGRHLKERNS